MQQSKMGIYKLFKRKNNFKAVNTLRKGNNYNKKQKQS
jgi:hypothetical protein